MEQFALEFDLTPERRIFSVSELNAAIRAILDDEFRDVWVSGEISGLKLASSGHYYFALKERDAQLKCVAFRSAHRYWKFKPADGLAVLARGRIDVYEVRGEYQLQVELLEPQGLGALQLAFEQLKKKLAAEGLFAAERKRPLPRFPRRIGIVTSPRGAAIADMINILSRRFPGLAHPPFPGAGTGPRFGGGGLPRHRILQPQRMAGRSDRGPRRRVDRGSLDLQRRSRGARHRRLFGAGGLGGGPRNRCHHRRFRGRSARAHAHRRQPSWSSPHAIPCTTASPPPEAKLCKPCATAWRCSTGVCASRASTAPSACSTAGWAAVCNASMSGNTACANVCVLSSMRGNAPAVRLKLGCGISMCAPAWPPAGAAWRPPSRSTWNPSAGAWRGAAASSTSSHTQLDALSPLKVLERGYAIVSNRSGIVKDAAAVPPASRIHVRLAKGELDAVVEE